MPPLDLPLWANVIVFLGATLAIGAGGTVLAGVADRLADRTGLGEATTGIVFLGVVTSLPGVAASVTAALAGNAALAISNAMGGIAVQTAALAVADLAYPKANLEHAAASIGNMLQSAVLIFLLTVVLVTLSGPEMSVAHVHPMTGLLFLAAGFGFVLVYRGQEEPMWRPRQTAETVEDVPEPEAERESLGRLLVAFLVTAVVVLMGGVAVAHSGGRIAEETGISQSLMGGLFMAISTSLPELVTTVAAVRRGAVTLAVSDIVGGNLFDVLFVCFADLAYFAGPIYHAEGVTTREVFLTALCVLLNAMLLLGLLYRQRRGPANIGFESVLMLLFYIAGFVAMWVSS